MKVRIPFVTTLLLSIFLLGCEDDTTVPMETADKELTPQEFFRSQFTLDHFEDPSGHVVENIEIDWNDYQTKTFNDKTWYEFKAIQHQPTEILGKDRIRGSFYSLLAYKDGDGSKMYLNKMLSYSDGEGFTYFNIAEKYYHGMVYLYNLEGEVEHLFHFQKGNLKHSVENIKLVPTETDALGLIARGECHQKASTARCYDALGCALEQIGSGCGSGGTGGSYVSVTTHYYTDWYNNRGGTLDYSHTQYNGSSSEWVWMSSNSGSSGYANTSYNYAVGSTNQEGYTSGTTYSATRPRNAESPTFKLTIDKSIKDNECYKSILKRLTTKDHKNLRLNNLGELEGTGHLSQGILKLFEDSANYNLNIRIADATTNNGLKRNAYTDPRRNYPSNGQWTFDIVLDKSFVKNATSLAIARTIVHESLHAFLYYSTQTYSAAPFSQLFYQYYAKSDVNTSQHELMTQFADAIGHSLSIYDNNRLSLDYYKNLAWSGDMLNTTAFGKLSNSRQTAIRNANRNEGDAANIANGSALGTKCQ